MRPKFIVFCLAAICLCFGIRGVKLTEDIKNTLSENARQAESSIMEIGMCFDWYGVIIVDSVIKTSHGLMKPSEMVEILEEESVNKDEYLKGYKKDITSKEVEYAEFVFAQDKKISSYVRQLVEWGHTNDIDSIKGSIPSMYEMTDPTIEAINNIMDTKMYYNEEKSSILNEKIQTYSDFMLLAIVLSVVMSICAAFSKRCH